MSSLLGSAPEKVSPNCMLGSAAFIDILDLPQFQAFDFDSIAAQMTFVLPRGYVVKAVFVTGTLKRLIAGASGYSVAYSDLTPTVTMGTSPGVAWVSIFAVLSNL